MARMDKIRVLWVQDTIDMPPRQLPDYLEGLFDVTSKSRDGIIWPVLGMEAFKRPLEDFWFKGKRDALPAEIMAVDYDLSKAPSTRMTGGEDLPDDGYRRPSAPRGEAAGGQRAKGLDFDGLLLGVFYATLTHRHPVGFVPTTYRLSEMTASVPDFQALSERILGIDFSFAGTERTWENIIHAGVRSLRERMKYLFRQGWCIFSVNDLMALIDRTDHDVLAFQSPHAMRRLPVEGLFVDIPEDQRRDAVTTWAGEMLEEVASRQDLVRAEELADQLWSAYDDDDLIAKREQLSSLIRDGKDEDALAELKRLFGVHGAACTDRCCDLFYGEYAPRVRRWASLLIILRLLKRAAFAQARIRQLLQEELNGYEERVDALLDAPIVTASDVYFALFPLPARPLVLPWHDGTSIDKSFGWVRNLMRLRDDALPSSIKGDNPGNLALHIPDVLAGESWGEREGKGGKVEGAYGLFPAERRVLEGIAFGDKDLTMDQWRAYGPAARVLFGKEDAGRSERD